MTSKRIGYIRVSTTDQNPDRQLEAMQLDKKFIDFASAKSTDRPQLKLMLDFVREGDVVIVHSMDRLARNLKDLKDIVHELVSCRVEVQFIKERLSFNGDQSASSMLILHLMGAFAEFEHAFIRERQAEGIAVAKRKGMNFGAKSKLTAEKEQILREAIKTRKTKTEIASMIGVSRFSVYKYLKDLGLKDEYCRG